MDRLVERNGPKLKSYVWGYVLAVVLTVVPFGLVAARILSRTSTLVVVAALGLAQILVHMRFFLHLDLRDTRRENLLALAFATVIVFIVVGGTVWIMFNLHYRMML